MSYIHRYISGPPFNRDLFMYINLYIFVRTGFTDFPPKKTTGRLKNSRHVNGHIDQVPSSAPSNSRRHHKKFSRLGDLTSGICVPLTKMYNKILRILKYYLKLMIYNHSSFPHFTTQEVGSVINRSSI